MKPVNIHYEEIVAGGTTVRQFEIAGEPGSTTAADTSLAPTTSPYGYVSGYQLIDMAPFEKQYKPDTFDWKALNHKTRKYYLTQNELIEGFREARKLNEDADPDAQKKVIEENSRIDKIVTYASGVGNVILLCSLVVAFAFSGAISLIASLMDAALDNLSIVVILVTSYMRHRVDPYKYPQGKERLEPVGVMIFSCIMATASLILIVESLQKLATDPYNPPDASIISIVLIAADLGMKAMLFVLCQRYASRSGVAAALTQDHRNDLVLNGTALVCTIIGAHYWAPTDPIGAILISLYTGHSWITTAFEQVELLTGATAEPDFIKKLTFICMNHDDRILAVDTVRVRGIVLIKRLTYGATGLQIRHSLPGRARHCAAEGHAT